MVMWDRTGKAEWFSTGHYCKFDLALLDMDAGTLDMRMLTYAMRMTYAMLCGCALLECALLDMDAGTLYMMCIYNIRSSAPSFSSVARVLSRSLCLCLSVSLTLSPYLIWTQARFM